MEKIRKRERQGEVESGQYEGRIDVSYALSLATPLLTTVHFDGFTTQYVAVHQVHEWQVIRLLLLESAAAAAKHVTKVTPQPVISVITDRNLNCRLNTKQISISCINISYILSITITTWDLNSAAKIQITSLPSNTVWSPVSHGLWCHLASTDGWLGGVMVRTLDLWLAVAGSNPGHDTACVFLR